VKRPAISQEGLKLLACVTMLLDHWAAVFVKDYVPYMILRGLGRIAFPIFCFLLVEGAVRTRSRRKYALRLAVGAVLSELPFDLAFFGRITLLHQKVMFTLLLGLGAICAMDRRSTLSRKLLIAVPFLLLGALLQTDYGWHGVLLICLLYLARSASKPELAQLGAIILACAMIPSSRISVFGIPVSLELAGIFAAFPIAAYRGAKRSRSRILQWAFYLFYPLHIGILWAFAAFL